MPLSRVFVMRFNSSSVPNVPFPAAHHTFTPRVSKINTQQLSPVSSLRSISNVSL